jgi:uncharacterized membrane protein YjjP (DUF1212 family)
MTQTLPLDVRFLKRFARRLHQAGVPAHQLEGMMQAIARKLGHRCEIWSSPTAIFLTLGGGADDEENQLIPVQLIRLEPGSTNLADTTELYEMGESLIQGQLSMDEAFQKLGEPADLLYPGWLKIVSGGLVSACFALMMGIGWQGALTALGAGLLVGLLYAHAGRALRAGGMEAIAAALVTLLVYAVNSFVAGIQPAGIIMSGLMILMPGLSLTTAVTELSTEHLSSGSARLAGALAVLLKLSLGVLLGTFMGEWLGWDIPGTVALGADPPAVWVQWPALLVSALSFGVIFNVRLREFPLAALAAVAGYGVSRLGAIIGGVELGVMLAALVIALLGNSLGRWLRLPAALVRVPGIILLVPGALGYRTVTNVLLGGDPSSQDTAVLVFSMVIALVGGLLIGNTIVPPRRHL